MNTVKVADFRNQVDHLFRIANVDFHSCVGASELKGWVQRAQRIRDEVQNITCKRASDYDKSQHLNALEAVNSNLEKSVSRIERYEQEA